MTVPISLVPGMRTVHEPAPHGAFSFETGFGPAPPIAAAVAFVLVSRPWLLLRRAATSAA